MFLGPMAQMAYMYVLCVYMFGSLWCYGTVFANAFAQRLPVFGPEYSYYGFLVIFGMFVLPLSCLDLKEQVTVQMVLSAGRVVMVFFMVGTIAVSYLWGSREDFGSRSAALTDQSELFAFRESGLQFLLPVSVFANILHHSVPALAEPVADKRKLGYIFMATLIFCFFAYSAIAMSVSLYFGGQTLSSSNLNWADYGSNASGLAYCVMRPISVYVMMFPALDVASAFPLNAITMGNSLFSVVYGKQVHSLEDSRRHKTAFRLMAAFPPLIMAALESNLGKITGYTGITGFMLAFIFPPLLAYYSHVTLANVGMPVLTIYATDFASPRYGAAIFLFGAFLLVYVPWSLFFNSVVST
jgi:hypothetical protein